MANYEEDRSGGEDRTSTFDWDTWRQDQKEVRQAGEEIRDKILGKGGRPDAHTYHHLHGNLVSVLEPFRSRGLDPGKHHLYVSGCMDRGWAVLVYCDREHKRKFAEPSYVEFNLERGGFCEELQDAARKIYSEAYPSLVSRIRSRLSL